MLFILKRTFIGNQLSDGSKIFFSKDKLQEEIDELKKELEQNQDLVKSLMNNLKQEQNSKSEFLANISHDLRTPLSLILGNLELAMEDKNAYCSPSVRTNIESSYKNAKRLVYLSEEINDLNRLEKGSLNLQIEHVQLVPFVTVLSDMFSSSAEFKGIKLTYITTLKSSDCVKIDTRQFEKIYYNLIANAIMHFDQGDTITISTSKCDDKIMLEFADTGFGIAPSYLPHLFDRFHSVTRSESQSRVGLGIGLPLVKELVSLHGGDISVRSELGKGSSFLISLPASKSTMGMMATLTDYIQSQHEMGRTSRRTESSSSIDLTNQEGKKSRILIVDDHPEIRHYIRQILEEKYDVKEAAHGLEGLDHLANQRIDLIVTDLMMPWMDGFELIDSIQNNPEYRRIPMLIVSARISDYDQEKVLTKGINNYLQKPFDEKELILRINNLVSTKSAEESFDTLAIRQNLESSGVEILHKVEGFIMENIEDTNLSVLQLGDAIAASERQVYRLIKKVTGKTPYEYITDVRLQYADYLIRKNKVRCASEAARNVGIKNVTTFNKQYEKRFGTKSFQILGES